MTTLALPYTESVPASISQSRSIPFSRLFSVEFRKVFTTRSTMILSLITVGLTFAAGAGAAALMNHVVKDGTMPWAFLASSVFSGASILLPVIAILITTSEWTQRTTLTTFSLEARRGRIIAAKYLVIVTITTICFALTYAVTAVAAMVGGNFHKITVDWTIPTKEILGSACTDLILVTSAFALGLAFMNSAAAIVVNLTVPTFLPALQFFGSTSAKIADYINLTKTLSVFSAGKFSEINWSMFTSSMALWVVLPLTLGLFFTFKREAK